MFTFICYISKISVACTLRLSCFETLDKGGGVGVDLTRPHFTPNHPMRVGGYRQVGIPSPITHRVVPRPCPGIEKTPAAVNTKSLANYLYPSTLQRPPKINRKYKGTFAGGGGGAT